MRKVSPSGHLFGVVEGEVPDANLTEDTHVDLQAEEGEDSQDKNGEDYHIAQVLHRVDDGAHDGLEAGDHSHRLEGPEHTERFDGGEGAQVDGNCHVGHPDHADVQPVPRVTQIRVLVHDKAARQELDGELVGVDGSKYHFCRRGVPENTSNPSSISDQGTKLKTKGSGMDNNQTGSLFLLRVSLYYNLPMPHSAYDKRRR